MTEKDPAKDQLKTFTDNLFRLSMGVYADPDSANGQINQFRDTWHDILMSTDPERQFSMPGKVITFSGQQISNLTTESNQGMDLGGFVPWEGWHKQFTVVVAQPTVLANTGHQWSYVQIMRGKVLESVPDGIKRISYKDTDHGKSREIFMDMVNPVEVAVFPELKIDPPKNDYGSIYHRQ